MEVDRLKSIEKGYSIYCSGGEMPTNGVDVILREDLVQYVENIYQVSDRIIEVRLGLEIGTKDFIKVYVPQSADECLTGEVYRIYIPASQDMEFDFLKIDFLNRVQRDMIVDLLAK